VFAGLFSCEFCSQLCSQSCAARVFVVGRDPEMFFERASESKKGLELKRAFVFLFSEEEEKSISR
jgi:hypothetical protein